MTPVERLRDSLLLGAELYEVPEHEAILAALDVVAAAKCTQMTTRGLLCREWTSEATRWCAVCWTKAAFESAVEGATT